MSDDTEARDGEQGDDGATDGSPPGTDGEVTEGAPTDTDVSRPDDAPEADTDGAIDTSPSGVPAGEHVLAVEGVDSGYGEAQVLEDLSLFIDEGEVICLIGPNGAGKSTVLKTVFGLLEPWTGSVHLSGEDITGLAPEELVRAGVGYVPQVDNVFSSLSIDENLRMGGVARDSGLERVVAELYEQFPLLDEKRDAKASTLSGGQRQVLALARALVMEPEVLLIDEPSAGLAPSIVRDVFENVQTVNELGTAILMVEQNAREGLAISDRGYVLDQGTVAYEGPADALLDDPEVSQLYLGGADYE